MTPIPPFRLIVGITGASGAIYGVRLLQILQTLRRENFTPPCYSGIEVHLVVSKPGLVTLTNETPYSLADIEALVDKVYAPHNIAAAIASGSYVTAGMIIAPCSIRTMSAIATGITDTLMSRAADVCLKERRRLVLMVRETPLHVGHLRTMTQLAEMGTIIAPPVPAFYNHPTSLDDIVDHSVGRILDLFALPAPAIQRWQGLSRV